MLLATILALLIAAVLNPNVATTVNKSWQDYSHPFSYQLMVPVPPASSNLA
jgi:hypothetical protein